MDLEENAIIKELESVFSSDNESNIHDAIAYIHENGSIKMMPLLFNLLATTSSETLKNDVYNCLMDTKDVNSIPLFIDALQDSRFINEKKRILSTLWQTNLDFSKHTDKFVNILLNDNYENAIEAFTLIEVCAENLSDEEKSTFKEKIQNALSKDKTEKAALLQATIDIL